MSSSRPRHAPLWYHLVTGLIIPLIMLVAWFVARQVHDGFDDSLFLSTCGLAAVPIAIAYVSNRWYRGRFGTDPDRYGSRPMTAVTIVCLVVMAGGTVFAAHGGYTGRPAWTIAVAGLVPAVLYTALVSLAERRVGTTPRADPEQDPGAPA